MMDEARRVGLRTMVGSMIGTSLAVAPGFIVGQLCDVVDLDGAVDPARRSRTGGALRRRLTVLPRRSLGHRTPRTEARFCSRGTNNDGPDPAGCVGRRSLLKSALAVSATTFGFPMLNLGRFQALAATPTKYSARAVQARRALARDRHARADRDRFPSGGVRPDADRAGRGGVPHVRHHGLPQFDRHRRPAGRRGHA